MLQMRKPCRLIEKPPLRQAGAVIDQIDRAGALARCKIEAPARIGAIEVDDARPFAARRAPGEIGAAQRSAIMRQPRLGKERRQPVAGGLHEPGLDGGQIVAGGRRPDVVQVDHGLAHASRTRPRSARVMAV